MSYKFLDLTGLAHLWAKISEALAGKADKDTVIKTQASGAQTVQRTGGGDTTLELRSGTGDSYICYRDSANTKLGYIGVAADKKPTFFDEVSQSENELAYRSEIPTNPLTLSAQGAYNANTCYDGKVWLVQSGSNCPSGSQYGSLFMMPYRKASGNTKPDFGVQIFLPNGDDSTKPNSLFYRTSLSNAWNAWQEISGTTVSGFGMNGAATPLKMRTISRADYTALSTKDNNTVYIVVG